MTIIANQLSCERVGKSVFTDLNFEINNGEVLIVRGANGSGKSSLLRCLTGLLTPSAGDISWNHLSIQQQREIYSQQLHYVGHQNGLKLGLTVKENLLLIQHLSSDVQHDFMRSLKLLNLLPYLDKPAMFLSAGQKRKLILAKLFFIPKPIWILDEPFNALDTEMQALFLKQLQIHLANNGIAVISSHQTMSLPTIKTRELIL